MKRLLVWALSAAPLAAQERCCELFAAASGPMHIEVTAGENRPSLFDIAQQYAQLTEQNLVIDEATVQKLQSTKAGLQSSLEVPAAGVQSFFEQLVVANGFRLQTLRTDVPRVVRIQGAPGRGQRDRAHIVQPRELDHYAKHPGTLVTTTLPLPNSDLRQLSTSLRALLTGNDALQIAPAGSSHSLVVTGYGAEVARVADLLRTVDAASRVEDRESTVRVIALRSATATRARTVMQSVFDPREKDADGSMPPAPPGTPRFLTDSRTNSLIVVARPDQLERIEAMIQQLDREL